MSIDIKYVPLTFIKSDDEILRQIKNTVYFSFLFGQFEETTLNHYLESTQYGYTASASPVGTHQLLRITDINNGIVDWQNVPFCNCDSELKYLLKNEDILIARTGGTTGKSFIVNDVPGNAIFASYLIRLRLKKGVDIEFINCFLNSYTFWSQIIEMKSGSAMPNVNAEKLKTLKLPKCDLETQQKVAAFTRNEENKVDNFNLLQKIESVESIFNTGNSISTELNHQLYLVKQLRQSFLREAMQGKLTGIQADNEENQETGKQLLEKIKAEKAQLIKDKKLKKEKELPPIKPEEIPFEIPENWVWCRFEDLIHDFRADVRTGPFGSTLKKVDHQKEGNPVWGIETISKDGQFTGHNKIYLTDKKFEELKSFSVIGGDLIISRSGTIAELCMLPDDIPAGIISTNLMKITIDRTLFKPELFCYIIKAGGYIDNMLGNLCSGSTRLFLTQKILKDLIFPLPPLCDQENIVTAIAQFLKTCDQLEASIEQSQQHNEQLLQQVLREALEVGTKDEQMKEVKIIKLPVLQHEEDFYYQKRKALATYIINHSLSDPWLGDTKLMKLLHLADYHAIKRNLGQKFYQKAAGPFDNGFIYPFFKEIENDGWFKRVKKDGRFYFSAGINHNLSLQTDAYFSQEELSSVDQVITYFNKDNYERPEIISTLYAVWNNRIIKGDPISDELIKQDFLDWDPQKIKYEFRLNNELRWMKDQGIIPNGWGRVIGKPRG